MSFTVAAAQMCSRICPQENLKEISALAASAAGAGAGYLLTPEVSVAYVEDREQLEQVAQPFAGNEALETAASIAQKNRLFLHIGSLAVALDDGRFANRSVLFSPKGELVDYYDKIHLFDARLPGEKSYKESSTYRGGQRAVLCPMGKIKLGLSICYDLRFGALYRVLGQAGAHLISAPAAFTVPTGTAHWEILVRARAIETGCYVVAAAQGGRHENGRTTYGHSMIVDPWGKVIAQKTDDTPGLIVAKIDPQKVQEARTRLPALANRAVFSLSVNHG